MTNVELKDLEKEIGDADTGRTLNEIAGSEKSRSSFDGVEAIRLEDRVAYEPPRTAKGQEQVSSEKKEDVPPNGGYGWVCIACCAIING